MSAHLHFGLQGLVPLLILTLLRQIRSTPKLWSSCTRNLVPISRIYYCFLTTKIKNPVTTETPKKSFIPHLRPFCLRHIRLTYELGLSEMYIHVSPNDVLSLNFDNKYFSWSKKKLQKWFIIHMPPDEDWGCEASKWIYIQVQRSERLSQLMCVQTLHAHKLG